MKEAKIEVRYYDILNQEFIDHSFSWDFLRVKETGHTVIWASFAKGYGGVINEAIYSNISKYKDNDLVGLWKDFYHHSKPFPFDEKELESEPES